MDKNTAPDQPKPSETGKARPKLAAVRGSLSGMLTFTAKWLLFLFLAGFLINTFIDNPYVHRVIRSYITDQLKQSGVNMRFQSISLQAMPPGVDIYGIQFDNTQSGDSIAQVQHVSASLSFYSAFLGELKLGEVVVNGVKLDWDQLAKVLPEGEADQPARWPESLAVPINQVSIANFSSFFDLRPDRNQNNGLILDVRGLNLEINLIDPNDLRATVNLEQLGLVRDGRALVNEGALRFDASLKDRFLELANLDLLTRRNRVTGVLQTHFHSNEDGHLSDISTVGQVDLEGEFSTVGSIIGEANSGGLVSGRLEIVVDTPLSEKASAAVTTNKSRDRTDLSITGRAVLEDAYLAGFQLYDSVADLEITANELIINRLTMHKDQGVLLNARGFLDFSRPYRLDFKLSPEQIDFTTLLKTLKADFDLVNFDLGQDELIVSGTGKPLAIRVRGKVLAQDLSIQPPPTDQPVKGQKPLCLLPLDLLVQAKKIDILSAKGRCFTDEVAFAGWKATSAKSLHSSLNISGRLHFAEQDGLDLKLSSPDFNMKLINPFSPLRLAGNGKLGVRVHGPYTDVLVNLDYLGGPGEVGVLAYKRLRWAGLVRDKTVFWDTLSLASRGGGSILANPGSLTYSSPYTLDLGAKLEGLEPAFTRQLIELITKDASMAFKADQMQLRYQGDVTLPLAANVTLSGAFSELEMQGQRLLDRGELKLNLQQGKSEVVRLDGTIAEQKLALGIKKVKSPDTKPGLSPEEKRQRQDDSPTFAIWKNLGGAPEQQLDIAWRLKPKTDSSPEKQDSLTKLPFVGSLFAGANVRGSLDLEGSLKGPLHSLAGAAQGQVYAEYAQQQLAPIRARLLFEDGQVDSFWNTPGDTLNGRMSFSSQEGWPYSWFFVFQQQDLGVILGKSFSQDARNFLYTDGTWESKGLLSDWWASRGSIKIDRIVGRTFSQSNRSKTSSFRIQSNSALQIRYDNKLWTQVQTAEQAGQPWAIESGGLRLTATLHPSSLPERLKLNVSGQADIGLLPSFVDLVEFGSGQIALDGEIKGALSDIKYRFNIADVKQAAAATEQKQEQEREQKREQTQRPTASTTWRPLSIGIKNLRPEMRDIEFQATLDEQGFLLSSLSAKKGNGEIQAQGAYLFDGPAEGNQFSFALRQATFVIPIPVLRTFDADVNGTATLTGSALPLRLDGDLQITRGRSGQDFDFRDEILKTLQTANYTNEAELQNPGLTLNLNVQADRTILIKNRNIQSLISTNLLITGSELQPQLEGQIDTETGKLIYKQEFDVVRALLAFDDPTSNDPNVNIFARSEFGEYQVFISISGRLSRPQVELSVEPATRPDGTVIDTLDILALLSRGSLPTDQKAVGDTLSEGLSVFAGQQVEEQLTRLFEISGQKVITQVYVDAYASERTGAPVARVNLPLQLVDGLDLVLRVDDESNWQASFENPLHENISISGFAGGDDQEELERSDQDSTGIDVNFDLRFRFSFP